MNLRLRLALPSLLTASCLLAAAAGVGAQAPADPSATGTAARNERTTALERCEASVVETLQRLRGKGAADVQFLPAQRAVTPGEDGEMAVKGAGRYRGAGAGNTFSYSCSFSTKTGLASGVVLREAQRAGGRDAWQPDLSRISPEACESEVAKVLTTKHPRVARIAMEPDTRRLEPGDDHVVMLLGQGAVQRAAGMNAEPFSYACEVDSRNGRVLSVKTSV